MTGRTASSPGGSGFAATQAGRTLSLLLRLGLAAVMAVAGVLKLRDPSAFALEIGNYQLLPALAPMLAAILPAVEVTFAVALLVLPRSWRQAAALGTTALMAVFLFAVSSSLARGVNIECGCFGGGGETISGLTVARNVALFAAAAAIVWLERPRAASALRA